VTPRKEQTMKRLIALFALAAAALLAERTGVFILGTLTATGQTMGVHSGLATHKHTLQVVVTGSPASCSVQLEGTLDDITDPSVTPFWANLSGTQSCTSSVTFHVVEKPVRAIRANLTALSGGSSPTVTIKYLGVQ
jgi:hypothetical protein